MQNFLIAALAVASFSSVVQAGQQCVLAADARPALGASDVTGPALSAPGSGSAILLASPAISLPFVGKVAAAGAQILDFGMVHGLRLIGARSGEEFRVFSVLPDGSAAVEGAPLAMTVEQLARLAAGEITQLNRTAGFDGFFVRSGPQFQVFYAAPDRQAVVPGILRDADGKNLTRDQVQGVPGAIPTVELQAGTTGPGAQGPESSLAAIRKAAFGTVGPVAAPEVFMVIDPQCIYSVRAYQQLQPYAASGKIRLSVVPVAILDHEDQGRSTKSALALLAKPSAEIPAAWQRGDTNGPATPAAQERLGVNMAIATSIGLTGTPTLLWRGRDGAAMRIDGMPTDVGALIASAGN